MMPITMAKAGETVTIKKITGKDEVRQHLAELGFVVDATVTVVNEIAGNLIIQVKESRIALDKTMANRIMIIAIFKNKANSRRNGTSLSSQKAKLSEKHIVSRSEEHPGSVP